MKNNNLRGTNETASPAEHATMKILSTIQRLTNQRESLEEITPDLAYMTILMVNLCFLGNPNRSSDGWVLIDAGLPDSAELIQEIAENRFGKNIKPKAIILTHGHFDHVGAITELIKKWNVEVYAHELELPYLTGKKNYPPGNPSLDKGLLAQLSPLYPNEAIDLKDMVKPLPSDGSIPWMPNWRWIHTPGHTPGHIALFRNSDGILIAGDAFTTVRQESATAVLTQDKEIKGPPAYFTFDWTEACQSVKKLKDLNPSIVITGHGKIMKGAELSRELEKLIGQLEKYAKSESKNNGIH